MALTIDGQYIRINWLNNNTISVSRYANRKAREQWMAESEQEYAFTDTYNGTSLENLTQGYNNLKKLIDFIGAEDC